MPASSTARPAAATPGYAVLAALGLAHLVNDLLQSLLPALYPVLKEGGGLSFAQLGLLTLAYQCTACVLQPVIGHLGDRRAMPGLLPLGMLASLAGLLALAGAAAYPALLAGAVLLGLGSAVFHPEASRLVRRSAGGAQGLAQSLFQVGGNAGGALGPLAAALVVAPFGKGSVAWFAVVALAAAAVLAALARQMPLATGGHPLASSAAPVAADAGRSRPRGRPVARALVVLGALIFSKYAYLACIGSYYTFFLMERFALSTGAAQLCLFVFFAAVALGTVLGGAVGDRIGRRRVIWASILGVLPFTLALPHVGLAATVALSAVVGLALASAFPAIVVYAQDLMPERVGMVSGLFFGLAFGTGGIAAAGLGLLADRIGVEAVFTVCSVLPALGLLAALLPAEGGAEGGAAPVAVAGAAPTA